MRILVAEDEVLTAMALQLVLQAGGHEVIGPVASMEHGLDVAAAAPPELALVDVTLSGDGDGLHLAHALAASYGTVCLLVTALPPLALTGADAAFGMIRKPYDPITALRSVEAVQRLMRNEPVPVLPRGLQVFTPLGVRLTPPL